MPGTSQIATPPSRSASQSFFTGATFSAQGRCTSRHMAPNEISIHTNSCMTRALPRVPTVSPNTLVGPTESHSKTRATQNKSSPKSSPFISVHIGAPCSIGALDHILNCGHKVLTSKPEECARNCEQPCEPHIAAHPSRSLELFTCMACITGKVAASLESKATSFSEELQMVARETGRVDPATWIKNKVAIVQMAWRDQSVEEIEIRLREGRMADAFYIDPEVEELVEEALQRRTSFSMVNLRRAEDETLSDGSSSERDEEASEASVWTSPASSATSISTSKSRSKIPIRKR